MKGKAVGKLFAPFVRLNERMFQEWQQDLPERIRHNLFLVVDCRMGRHARILTLLELSTGERIGCDSDDLDPASQEEMSVAFGYHGYPRLNP